MNGYRFPIILATMVVAMAPAAHATLVQFGSYDYELTSSPESWTAAEAEAVADGGHLASVPDSATQIFLQNTFLTGRFANLPLWIGLYDPDINDGGNHASRFYLVGRELGHLQKLE